MEKFDLKTVELVKDINYCGAVMTELADKLASFGHLDKTIISKAGELRGAANLLLDDWRPNIKKVFQNECEK